MSKRRHEGDSAPAKVQRGADDAADDSSRKSLLKAHIIGLNSQFASWVSSQEASRSDALWIEGARDYVRFAEGLVEEFGDVVPLGSSRLTGKASEPAPKPASNFMSPPPAADDAAPTTSSTFFGMGGGTSGSAGGFGFGSKPPPSAPTSSFMFGSDAEADKSGAEATDKDVAAAAQPGNAFGTAPAFAFGAAAGFNFSSDATKSAPAEPASAAPAFAFGSASTAPSEASPTLFAFGKPAAANASAPMFSFGGASAPGSGFGASNGSAPAFSFGNAATTAPANGGEDAEAEEEGPAKFESAVTVNEESGSIVFKAKSKFSHLAKDASSGKASWESKGVGTFMLRTRNDESKKPFVTFTTEAGRVLYIANIPKAMAVILIEAKNAVSFSAPWAPDGTSTPTPQGVMFAFPKGLNTAFKAEVEKCQASMAS